jgi:hypothetical protein
MPHQHPRWNASYQPEGAHLSIQRGQQVAREHLALQLGGGVILLHVFERVKRRCLMGGKISYDNLSLKSR